MQRPTMKFVATKTVDQLDLQAMHRVRERVSQSPHWHHHQIRAFLLKCGIAVRQGQRFLRAELPRHLPSAHVQASLFLAYELRDMLGHLLQINFREICQSDGCQFFFDVPRQDRFETLKRTVVTVYGLAAFLSDLPCESVGMRLAALEHDRCKDLRPAFRF